LENNLITNAFTEDRLSVLKLLSTQIAISLQNALLYSQNEQARHAAEAANRAKSTFLANMGHELRTPLNSILGFAQLFKQDNNLTKPQQDRLHNIQRSGHHLLTLLNDILDLSKIEADHIKIHPNDFHFGEFLKDITEVFRMRTEQKKIAFTFSPLSILPTGLHADEKRLRQILINLLGNAVKFTKQGGVTLKVGYVASEEPSTNATTPSDSLPVPRRPKIRFQIEDTGIGIAPEELGKIFLPFQQAGDPKYRPEGTGLGLSITKRLIELMGGQLQVESVLGKGSTFWTDLELPPATKGIFKAALEQRTVIIGYQATHPRRQAKIQILVVDDQQENRTVVASLLLPLGFEVVEARHGQEGLEKARKRLPDLILSDLVMPVMDGFEFIRQLRKLQEFKEVPVIVMSGSIIEEGSPGDVRYNGAISKPIRAEVLLECLQTHLGLAWVYKQEKPVPEDLIHQQVDLMPAAEAHPVGLSAAQAEVLLELAEIGDIAGMIQYADNLEQEDKQLEPLAKKIRQLADEFETDELCELAKQYRGNK
jgi:signal transduction histidine kinase/DNA-binding response OmpR family regulator